MKRQLLTALCALVSSTLIAAEALNRISHGGDQPWFVYVPFHAVHTPVDAPGRLSPGKVTAPLYVGDWLPTVAGLVGLKPAADPGWDGLDRWDVVSGANATPPARRRPRMRPTFAAPDRRSNIQGYSAVAR